MPLSIVQPKRTPLAVYYCEGGGGVGEPLSVPSSTTNSIVRSTLISNWEDIRECSNRTYEGGLLLHSRSCSDFRDAYGWTSGIWAVDYTSSTYQEMLRMFQSLCWSSMVRERLAGHRYPRALFLQLLTVIQSVIELGQRMLITDTGLSVRSHQWVCVDYKQTKLEWNSVERSKNYTFTDNKVQA